MNQVNAPSFTGVLQSFPFGICILDKGKIEFINQKFSEILGYKVIDLNGKSLDVLSWDGTLSDPKILTRELNRNDKISIEKRLKHKNGKAVDALLTFSILNPDSIKDKIIVTAIDITTQKKMEDTAHESEQHIKSLMESATSFVVYRFAADETAPLGVRVVFVSSSMKDFLGLPETAKFENWFETIHPDDLDKTMAALRRAWQIHHFNETFRIIHQSSKEIRWVHAVTNDIVDEHGRTKFMNGIFIDVTEQKKIEEDLEYREKELETKTDDLRRANLALNNLLKRRDDDKSQLEENVLVNLKEFIIPYIELFKNTNITEKQQALLQIIDRNLSEIIPPLSKVSIFKNLTPAEFQIANFIKLGKTSKEIAEILDISPNTIDTHRRNMRKKIGIGSKKGNLRTHLLTSA